MFIVLSIFFLVAAEARDDVSALVSSFETPLRALREDFAAQEEKVSMLTTKVLDDRATSATHAKLLEGLLERMEEQEMKSAGQKNEFEEKIAQQDEKNRELNQKIAQQDEKNTQQDEKNLELNQKIAQQDEKNRELNQKISDHRDDLSAKDEELAAQAKEIAALRERDADASADRHPPRAPGRRPAAARAAGPGQDLYGGGGRRRAGAPAAPPHLLRDPIEQEGHPPRRWQHLYGRGRPERPGQDLRHRPLAPDARPNGEPGADAVSHGGASAGAHAAADALIRYE